MAVCTVLRMGHPLLQRIAAPVERFGTAELRRLVTDMDATMRSLRAVIFEVTRNPRYPQAEPVPYTVLLNPVLDLLGSERDDAWEGCLSVPGLRGMVARHTTLRYRGFDLDGRPIDRTVTGFHARVVQHEVDHLDGILYPMRMADMRSFGFEDELFPDRSAVPPD
jgi:peptide deformylase